MQEKCQHEKFYNKEFIIHHKIFDNNITFIEDLKDIGLINKNKIQICAIPLKMDYDGAPMRTILQLIGNKKPVVNLWYGIIPCFNVIFFYFSNNSPLRLSFIDANTASYTFDNYFAFFLKIYFMTLF